MSNSVAVLIAQCGRSSVLAGSLRRAAGRKGPSTAQFSLPDPHLCQVRSRNSFASGSRAPPARRSHPHQTVSHKPAPRRIQQPTTEQLRTILGNRLPVWSTSARAINKLRELGFQRGEAIACLNAFAATTLRQIKGKGKFSAASNSLDGWDFESLSLALGLDPDWSATLERTLLRQCLQWAITEVDLQLDDALRTKVQQVLDITDLRYLSDDFLETRQSQRHFHLHIGPTNSGKTYNALKALASAETGAYAGPLRLLAHEVWERLNRGTVGELAEGIGRECNLITGEERRIVSLDAGLISCTVEMLPLDQDLDVVVIDEIQMIGDPGRGSAWTKAIIGVAAKEVHLCGEETVVGVVTKLVEGMGDRITIHRYERLTPLAVADKSLDGDFGRIEDGDCVVCFSRSGIFATKKSIEQKTGKRCAVVYGALPPETRSEQARIFNEEGSGVNVMVASDAVGMGLNL